MDHTSSPLAPTAAPAEIATLRLEGVDIWWMPIPPGGRGDRRAREQAAIATLLQAAGISAPLQHLPSGMPVVEGIPCLSVAHSVAVAAIAVAPWPMGIDVEEPRQEMLRRVVEKFLTPEERPAVADDRLLWAWTCKEAGFKAACAQGEHPHVLLDIPLEAYAFHTVELPTGSLLTLAKKRK